MMVGSYDYRLVALSVLIAILASYVALDLAGRVTAAAGRARLAWLGGGASVMGFGIWAMHYIGMLAFSLPVPVSYDWPTVVVSLVAAIIASGIALYVVSRRSMGWLQAVSGSIFMGAGIAAMHYIGMAAMRQRAMCQFNPWIVALSVVLAIVVSLVAIWLAFYFRGESQGTGWWKMLSALVMGAAIPVMHYTGMAAASFSPSDSLPDMTHAMNITTLGAACISIVTALILGLALLTSLVDRRFSAQNLELKTSEERLRLIIASALDSVISMDAHSRVAAWNPQAELTFGWPRQEVLGKSLYEVILPDRDRPAHERGLQEFLKTGAAPLVNRRVEITALHRDGREFPAELALSAMSVGRSWFFNAFVRDITERKRTEKELQTAKETAESANHSKSDFLANMSHEIRTPMNAIVGMTELALDTELTHEQREYLNTVKIATDSLLTLINDILDFSKIEAGKLDLDSVEFSLRESVESIMKTLALRAHEKGLELNLHLPDEIPDVIQGDPDRLRQVLINLLGNAIKFTAKGEVDLAISERSRSDSEIALQFMVRDTGIGIAQDKVKTIFEAFTQADTSTTRHFGGTGLGLAIASRLVALMSGEIWVESQPGFGSTFIFTGSFGFKKGALQRPLVLNEAHLIDLPVLIVDDNETNRLILEELLVKWGMRPVAVDSGMLALDALQKAQAAGTPYTLVLLDVHMPGMDGFEVAQRVQRAQSSSTIMMLTSAARQGDIARCKDLGVAAYLIKPIRRGELLEAMLGVLGQQATTGKVRISAQRPANERRGGVRILLVEDNRVNQTVAMRLLEKQGHRVVVAGNGREALLALGRLSPNGFDLILMDVQMPEMDGFEATAAIRQMEKNAGSHIPIIAMTAHAMKGDREQCLAAGMDGYISKPIRANDLLELIEQWVGLPARAAEQSPNTAPPELPSRETVLELFGGDTDLFREAAAAFLEECAGQLTAVRAALEKGDSRQLERSAHLLKGSIGNFAAPAAFQAAQILENAGRCGELRGAQQTLDELEGKVSALCAALQELKNSFRTEYAQ